MERFSGKTCVGLISLAVIVTIPLAFFPHTAWTAQYTFTTLKHPSAMNDIYATGLNNSGQVTGYYYEGGITYGFVYSSGDFTTLYGPFAFATYAFGINNNGEVTGYYADSKWGYHGFVYSGSDFNTLDVLYAYYTSAFGINNNGDVTGYYADSNWGWHGFVYSGGDFNKLDVPYARNTYSTRINDSGQ